MTRHLFVYGTLRPSLAPPAVRPLAARLRPVSGATVAGRLYDLGAFPAAVLDELSEERITGELVELPDDPHLLTELDRYEGFDARRPEGSLFVRRETTARLPDGREAPCWIYVWHDAAPPGRRVTGGDYAAGGPDPTSRTDF